MARYLKAELIKLASVRSTWITSGLVVLFSVGIGLLASGRSAGSEPAGAFQGHLMAGVNVSQLIVMVLAALVICNEYRFGIIRSTLTAEPNRLRLMGAKVLAVVIGAAVLGTLTTFLTFFIAGARLSSVGYGISIGDPGVLRALLGTVGVFIGSALMAFAVGSVIRNQTATISLVVVYPLAVEPILSGLLSISDSTKGLAKYLPWQAGFAIQRLDSPGGSRPELSPGAGLALMIGVAIFMTLIATLIFERRDA